MKRTHLWKPACAVLSAALLLSATGAAHAQSDRLTPEALANAAYPVADAPGGVAQLKDGKFDDPTSHVNVTLVAPTAYGDANIDGKMDAAVQLAVNTGGSGVFSYLAVVLNDNGVAKPADSVFLGDRIRVRDIVFGRNFEIQVSLLERRYDQAMVDAPTIPVVRRFRLSKEGKLIAVSPLTNADLIYSVYPLESLGGGRAIFVDGKFEDEKAQVSAQIARAPRANGDLDGDGSPDTALLMSVNTGGSGVFATVCAVLNKGYLSQPAACDVIGDRVRVTNLSINNGEITVTYLDRRDGQPMSARPTVRKTSTIKLQLGEGEPVPTVPAAPAAEAPAAPPPPPAGTAGTPGIVNYVCADGAPLSVTFGENQAIATFGADIVATLRQQVSGSGAVYANDQYELLLKGVNAHITDAKTGDLILRDCKAQAAQPPLAPAPPAPPAGSTDMIQANFVCANGLSLKVIFDNVQRTALVTIDGPASETRLLQQTPSGSGIRYADEAWEFRGKGTDAMVLKAGTEDAIAADCKEQPASKGPEVGATTAPTATTPTTETLPVPTAVPTDTAATGVTTETTTMTETVPAVAELNGVLTGTVTYLQRMALDPGAVVEVSLSDVSRADAPATLITSQVIQTLGQQVPIAFELKYDPALIEQRMTYAVSARITVEGKLRWISTTRYSVLTRGAPVTGVEIVVDPVSQ